MKFKYLAVAILIFLVSLGTVAASDDIINDLSLGDSNDGDVISADVLAIDTGSSDGDIISADVLAIDTGSSDGDGSDALDDDTPSNEMSLPSSDSSSNSDSADLSMGYYPSTARHVNDQLQLEFFISNDYGVAQNTKVNIKLSGVEYLSHNASKGTYDFKKGIWDIGTLDSGDMAFLTIETLIKDNKVTVDASATTSSNDIDEENNHISDELTFEDELGPPGPVSESSDQPSHSEHYGSSSYGSVDRVVVEDDDSQSSSNDFNVSKDVEKSINKNINGNISKTMQSSVQDYLPYLLFLLIIGIAVLIGVWNKKR